MAVSTPIYVPESCPTIGKKPENIQRELWEAFESAVVKAQKQGIPMAFGDRVSAKGIISLSLKPYRSS